MNDYTKEVDELFGTPSSLGPADPTPRVLPWRRSAAIQGTGDLEEDPDTAARAIQLSKATGTPAPVIHGDLDSFELQHRTQMTADVIQSSPHIQDYINNFPLASKVSNDDYFNLDNLGWLSTRVVKSVGDKFFEGLKEGFGEEPLGASEDSLNKTAEYFGLDRAGLDEALEKLFKVSPAFRGAGPAIDTFFRLPRAAIHGLAKGGAALAHSTFGMDEKMVEKEIGSALEWAMNRGDLGTIAPKISVEQATRVVSKARVYIEAGEVPPPGVDMFLDAAKYIQATDSLQALREAQKAARESKTIERSPDAGEEFLRGPTEGRTLGISADAVMELYKEKPPEPGDGLLGWVPGIGQQLRTAAQTGSDIQVSLAGWLAHMDPAVAKQLEEHVRVHTHGVTVFEAEAMKEREKIAREGAAPDTEALPKREPITAEDLAMREAALDEPLAQVGKRDLRLKKTHDVVVGEDKYSSFDLFDEKKKIGSMTIQETNKGMLYVENIEAYKGGGANALGLHAVKALFEELKREYPNATSIGGYRVSGAREAATKATGQDKMGWAQVSLKDKPEVLAQFLDDMGAVPKGWEGVEGGPVREAAPQGTLTGQVGNVKIEWRPSELLSAREHELIEGIQKVLAQIAPGLKWGATDRLEVKAAGMAQPGSVLGVYVGANRIGDALMLTTLRDPGKSIGTVLHEVIHHLRSGFFTKEEWAALEKAAQEGEWIDKHEVGRRYSKAPEWLKLEEAIAEEYAYWADQNLLTSKVPKEVVSAFQRVKDMLSKILEVIREVYGKEITFDELFVKVSAGEIGSRTPVGFGAGRFKEIKAEALAMAEKEERIKAGPAIWANKDVDLRVTVVDEPPNKGPDGRMYQKVLHEGKESYVPLDELREDKKAAFEQATVIEEAQMFARGAAIGMTAPQFKKLMSLFNEQRAETEARAKAKAEQAQQVTKTEQWKENEPRVKDEVTVQVNQRPDIMADEYFRRGYFNGEVTKRSKLGAEFLTDEQKAALGPSMVSAKGLNPTSVAGLFGYLSGEDMVRGLVALQEARTQLKMTPAAYKTKLIREQTEVQMIKKYGLPEHDRLLREAREDIITETTMDILYEPLAGLAMKAGQPPPLSKAMLVEMVKKDFATIPTAQAKNMEAYLRGAGRAGRASEAALLKEDYVEVFKQHQRQTLSTMYAAEAKKLGKELDRFDRTAKKFAPREVKGVEHEFTSFIKMLLDKAGFKTGRTPAELQDGITRSGFASLESFINAKNLDGWELTASDAVLQGNIKPVEAMTVAEFHEFKDTVDSLAFVGRKAKQIDVLGEARDFDVWKEGVLDNIRSLPPRNKNKPMRIGFRADAELTRMEEMVKDLDLRQELGPLFNAMIAPMMESKHTEYTMTEKLGKTLREVKGEFGKKWQKTLNDDIPQNFFKDPYDNTIFDLNRQNMINIMLNFGSRSNINKFTYGYVGKDHAPVFERQLWDLFNRHATKEDWQYVQKMWDIFEGWKKDSANLYYDLSGVTPKWVDALPITNQHGTFAGGYFPIIYDKLRSNINVVQEGSRSVSGMFTGNYFRATTANHYTKERTGYVDRVQFQNSIEQTASRMQQIMHDIAYRRAVINVDKVLRDRDIRGAIRKHYGAEYEAQLDPWIKDIANHFNQSEQAISWANSVLRRSRYNLIAHALGLNLKVLLSPDVGKFNPVEVMTAMGNIGEYTSLAHEKSREIPHTFRNMDRDFRERLEQTISKNRWTDYEAGAVRWAFGPIVKVSQGFRIITFVTKYKEGIAQGLAEGEAVARADSFVRERHGSGGLPDLPAIMRSNEAMKMSTMFYSYFNAMYNWQRQTVGNVRRGEWMKGMEAIYGAVLIPAAFGAALFNKSEPGESWFKLIAKALTIQPLSTLPFVREFSNFFIEGFQPRSPLESIMLSMSSVVTDIKNYQKGKRIEKPIQHAANVIGLTRGLPLGQVGRTGQFSADVAMNHQRPRNIQDWWRGIIHGDVKPKK